MAGWPNLWIDLAALSALVGMIAYALFGGADFGGGVWDLFAFGPRKRGQRLAIVLGRDGRELGIVSLQDILKAIFGEVKL